MADSSPSATFNTHKLGLLEPILFGNIAAKGASPAGVIRRHRNKQPASPSQCVFQLAAKLAPLLVENGLIQTRLLLDPFAELFAITLGILEHVPNLQILNANERVVLAWPTTSRLLR